MGERRDVGQDGSADEDDWRDDPTPASSSDQDQKNDGLNKGEEGTENKGVEKHDVGDRESGAGYGNHGEVPSNPD